MPPKRRRPQKIQLTPVREERSFSDPPDLVEAIEAELRRESDSSLSSSEEERDIQAARRHYAERIKNATKPKENSSVQADEETRRTVIEALRMSFERKEYNDANATALGSLTQLLNKMRLKSSCYSMDVLLNELDMRLGNIMESSTLLESRKRVLELVADFAVFASENQEERIIEFICEPFISSWHQCVEQDSRLNVVYLISYIIAAATEKVDPARPSDQAEMTIKKPIFRKVYSYLMRLLFDKPLVRAEVVRCLGRIQNMAFDWDFFKEGELSPKEILLKSLRDVAWEVRLVAVQLVDVTVPDHVKHLHFLALADKNSKVRVVAIQKYSKLSFKLTSDSQRLDLVTTLLRDHEYVIREATRNFILTEYVKRMSEKRTKARNKAVKDGRIKDVDRQTLKHPLYSLGGLFFFYLLPVPKKLEDIREARNVAFNLLDVLRGLYKVHLEPVEMLAMELCNDSNIVPPNVVTREQIDQLSSSLIFPKDRATIAMFWRFCLEYMSEKARDQCDAEMAIQRMSQTMTRMCTLITECIPILDKIVENSEPHDHDQNSDYCHRFLLHMLMGLRHLELETSGMEAWKRLLQSMLMRSYPKYLIDVIVQDLSQHFFANDPDGLESLVDEMVLLFINFGRTPGTSPDDTISMRDDENPDARPDDVKSEIYNDDAMEYELKLTNAVLKTDFFKVISSGLRYKWEKRISKALVTNKFPEQMWAVEVAGILAMIEPESVSSSYATVNSLMRRKHVELETRKACVDMLIDSCLIYGYEKTNQMIYGDEVETNPEECQLVHYFSNVLYDPHEDQGLCLKVCEGVGKLLLNERTINFAQDHWKRMLILLIFRWTDNEDTCPKIRSALSALLKFFASLSRTNQLAIVKLFKDFYDETLATRSMDSEYERFRRLTYCAPVFAILSRHSLLSPSSPGYHEPPVHVDLLQDCINELLSSGDSLHASTYCSLLSWIEIDNIPVGTMQALMDQFIVIIEMNEPLADQRQKVSELRKIVRRMQKVLNGEGDDEREDSEQPIKQEPLDESDGEMIPKMVSSARGRGAARVARTASRAQATPAKNILRDLREVVETPRLPEKARKNRPSKTPVVVENVPESSRAHLKRSARKKIYD